MTTEELLIELDQIFCHVLNKTSIILTPETTAKDVDGWDSLTNMQLISEIEAHYKIRFKLHEIIKSKQVGDLCETILKKLPA
jgi:acyl carrier protein